LSFLSMILYPAQGKKEIEQVGSALLVSEVGMFFVASSIVTGVLAGLFVQRIFGVRQSNKSRSRRSIL
jgi:hypothetical protein